MSSACHNAGVFLCAAIALMACHGCREAELSAEDNRPPTVIRIACDPNNMPFSNSREKGFENKIARIIANELGADVEYVWRAQRRGFLRETLGAGTADIVVGVPAACGEVLTTRPYYRSTYVLVSRSDEFRDICSIADERLKTLRIGVQLVGDSGCNTPPAHALVQAGLGDRIVGYPITGDYREPDPPARVIEALARGELDVAIAWGPTAGYFASRHTPAMHVTPLVQPTSCPLPFQFDIAMAVAKDNRPLRDRLDLILEKRREDIDRILHEYAIPMLPFAAADAKESLSCADARRD